MPDVAKEAVMLAEKLLRRALAERRPAERSRAAQLSGLISDPAAKQLSMAMADRLMRSPNAQRASLTLRRLIGRYGLPRGLGLVRDLLLASGAAASLILPGVVMSAVRRKLRSESRDVILNAEPAALAEYLQSRRAVGWRVNLNLLGEAILGEEDARARRDSVLALLARADVDYVSVKISALFSQINLLAWDQTVTSIKDRLRPIYRTAQTVDPKHAKFVNLDMEEYRDLALTTAAFCELLDEPEFHALSAGIVLQAYLPDSWDALRALTQWSQSRVKRGGPRIKVRLVKGANLAMERVEATLHGWSIAPYQTKAETDSNFKRMLEFATRPENAAAVRLGVGSHNLFDVALALILRTEQNVAEAVEIEMLEGMVNHQARAVSEAAGGVLVYAPIVSPEHFESALAYLVRRLDENTADENFLRHLFDLTPGGAAWVEQERRFLAAWEQRETVSSLSRRISLPSAASVGFENIADTDWTQRRHRDALCAAIARHAPIPLPPVPEAEAIFDTARSGQPRWEAIDEVARAEVLRRFAKRLGERRFETIALLQEEGKKAITEADAEVSEAIDFANYYASVCRTPTAASSRALGTVVVAPPWNFPFAIPAGGVLAALMAGNVVVLKPAPETQRLGHWLALLLWEAGVPTDALQFVACDDGDTGRRLITDPRTSAVILTGGYETARLFQAWRPSLRLFAETSGKNAIVVSALADRDLAVRDIVRSAFGHSGQKCSATSLAILEAEVYDDPAFRRQLRDAAASLPVGPATDLRSVVTPLIRPPGEALRRGLTMLEDGESWLLQPNQIGDDPCLWSPGIKLGVCRGSWFHETECFGPVLGVIRADDLAHATRIQNDVRFGLTAGFHSLDDLEIATWCGAVQAGNLYVNRSTTGAIVRRQPFGGWKASSIGPGSKAGGPNYVGLFRTTTDLELSDESEIEKRFHDAWSTNFGIDHDPSALGIEKNIFRYRPSRGVVLRLREADARAEAIAQLAAKQCSVRLVVSRADLESEAHFIARLPVLAREAEFFRTVAVPSDAILSAAYAAGLNWIDAPLSGVPEIELPRWLREQSLSITRHRYGNPIEC